MSAFARSAILVALALTTACEPSKPAASESGDSGVGETCFESMLRAPDGGAAVTKRCKAGLVCDYTGAVPDGPGHCKQGP